MEQQVLTIEQMKHLQELGVDINVNTPLNYDDIIVLLPKKISGAFLYSDYDNDAIVYREYDAYRGVEILKSFSAKGRIIDAAYKMLCWCVENVFIRTTKK